MNEEEAKLIREREQEHGARLREALPDLTLDALRGRPPDRGGTATRRKRPKPVSPITTGRSR